MTFLTMIGFGFVVVMGFMIFLAGIVCFAFNGLISGKSAFGENVFFTIVSVFGAFIVYKAFVNAPMRIIFG